MHFPNIWVRPSFNAAVAHPTVWSKLSTLSTSTLIAHPCELKNSSATFNLSLIISGGTKLAQSLNGSKTVANLCPSLNFYNRLPERFIGKESIPPDNEKRKNYKGPMKIKVIQRGLPPIGFWAHEFLSGANSRLKYFTAKIADDEVKLSCWQVIFAQSRANGCFYDVEDLPHANWQWPKNTWFQDRLGQQPKDPRDY